MFTFTLSTFIIAVLKSLLANANIGVMLALISAAFSFPVHFSFFCIFNNFGLYTVYLSFNLWEPESYLKSMEIIENFVLAVIQSGFRPKVPTSLVGVVVSM